MRGFAVGYGCITCWCLYLHRAGKCGDLLWGMDASHVGVCMCTERGNAGICCGVWVHHMLVCVCAPSEEMRGFVVGYGCVTCWCVYVHQAGKCGDLLWGMGASHVGVCMCTEPGNAGICCGVWVHHMLVCVCAPSREVRGFPVGYGCITCWCLYVHRAGKCGGLLWGMGASHVGVCMCTERGNAGICCGVGAHHMLVFVCARSPEMRGFVVGYECIISWCVYIHRAGKCGDLLWVMGASHVGVCMCTEPEKCGDSLWGMLASHVGVCMCTKQGKAGIRCGVWVHHMVVCVCALSGEMRGFAVGHGCITCWCAYVHRAGKCGDLLWGMSASDVGVCMCTKRGNPGICCGVWVHHMLVFVCAPSGEMRGFFVGYGCITCWCVYVHRAGKCGDSPSGMGASHVGVCMCTERGNAGICCGVWVHHLLVCVCAPSGEMRGFAVGYGCITCWCLYVHRAGKCGDLLFGMGASHVGVCMCTERGNAGICCGVWVHHMLVCVFAPSWEMRGFVVGYGCITCWCVYVH